MSIYINPVVGTKEDWLATNAEPAPNFLFFGRDKRVQIFKKIKNGGDEVICLVDNGSHTAAAVVDCVAFFNTVCSENDPRPKRFYRTKREKIVSMISAEELKLLDKANKRLLKDM
jgi:hypothetical protein